MTEADTVLERKMGRHVGKGRNENWLTDTPKQQETIRVDFSVDNIKEGLGYSVDMKVCLKKRKTRRYNSSI